MDKFLAKVTRSSDSLLPYSETIDDYLRDILKVVRPLGEDLREQQFYINKPWLELRDTDDFKDTILHYFNLEDGEGEYLRSFNGDVKEGVWRFMASSNKLLITLGNTTELYDLAFLDNEFFILSKHGDNKNLGRPEYFVMAVEPLGKRLEWREAMESLYNKYRNSNSFYIAITLFVLVLVVIVLLLSR